MPRVQAQHLRSMMNEVVDKENSKLHTDQLKLYRKLGREYGKGHGIVNHSAGEYVKGDVTINTAESFFALLKRGHYGVFHLLSKQHLHRYCNEFSFRWKYRKVSDGERLAQTIKRVEGKRLTYKGPVNRLATPEVEHPF